MTAPAPLDVRSLWRAPAAGRYLFEGDSPDGVWSSIVVRDGRCCYDSPTFW